MEIQFTQSDRGLRSIEWTPVQSRGLDQHRRWNRIGSQIFRVHFDSPLAGGKEQFALGGFPAGGLRATIEIDDRQPILWTKRPGAKRLYLVDCKIVEVSFTGAEETMIAAHPEVASAIFQQTPHRVVEQTVFDSVGREL